MVQQINTLLTLDIQDIVKSPEYSIMLLRVYSIVYLQGAECSACEKSLKKYHKQIIKNGLIMAKKIDIKINVCKKAGLIRPTGLGRHINLQTMSDDDANYLLKNKLLTEIDFKILPKKVKAKKSE